MFTTHTSNHRVYILNSRKVTGTYILRTSVHSSFHTCFDRQPRPATRHCGSTTSVVTVLMIHAVLVVVGNPCACACVCCDEMTSGAAAQERTHAPQDIHTYTHYTDHTALQTVTTTTIDIIIRVAAGEYLPGVSCVCRVVCDLWPVASGLWSSTKTKPGRSAEKGPRQRKRQEKTNPPPRRPWHLM